MSGAFRYVLDSYALLVYFNAGPGGVRVGRLFEAARKKEAMLYMSLMNVGELYYLAYRHRSLKQADAMIYDLRSLPVELCSVTEDRIFAAGRLKAKRALSFADCFVAGLAQELEATIVTGDTEFKAVEPVTPVLWLPGTDKT